MEGARAVHAVAKSVAMETIARRQVDCLLLCLGLWESICVGDFMVVVSVLCCGENEMVRVSLIFGADIVWGFRKPAMTSRFQPTKKKKHMAKRKGRFDHRTGRPGKSK